MPWRSIRTLWFSSWVDAVHALVAHGRGIAIHHLKGLQMETFIIVHPDFPECVGDANTLAAWAPLGWKRKGEEPEAEEAQAPAVKPAKAKK